MFGTRKCLMQSTHDIHLLPKLSVKVVVSNSKLARNFGLHKIVYGYMMREIIGVLCREIPTPFALSPRIYNDGQFMAASLCSW